MLKPMCLAAALTLASWAAPTWAHAHLVRSVPANGATVAAAPGKFVLSFAEPAKLTALSLQKNAEPARKLSPLPRSAAAEVSIPAPQLSPGKYVLSWRAVGDDGHVVPGKVTFTIGS